MALPTKLNRTLAGIAAVALVASLAACGNNNENAKVGTDVGSTDDMGSTSDDMGSTDDDMGSTDDDMGSTGDDMGSTGDDVGMADAGTDAGTDMGADMGSDMGQMPDELVIFDDAVGAGLTFAPFGGSINDVAASQEEAFTGTSSLKAIVPSTGYTGGAYVPAAAEDLSSYNALRFHVKASQAATLNAVGFGNTGAENIQQVELNNLALTTDWQEVIIPIPDPSLATANSGLFHFAEASDEGPYDIYFDDISFVSVDPADFTNAAPAFGTTSSAILVGQTTTPVGTALNVDVQGTARTFAVQPFYFEWTSSDPTVATVDNVGLVTGVAAGTASITATLAGTAAGGQLDVTVNPGPAAAAPAPSTAPADVEASIYSNAYTNVTVNTLLAGFSAATLTPLQIAGDDTLVYGALDFAGIEMIGPNSVDITAATMMHIDIWTPDAALFGIKLVDFGADNAFAGGDDSEHQVDLTSPADFTTGQWVSLDIPLSTYESNGLTARANLSQIILVGRIEDANQALVPGATVFVDNFYFY